MSSKSIHPSTRELLERIALRANRFERKRGLLLSIFGLLIEVN